MCKCGKGDGQVWCRNDPEPVGREETSLYKAACSYCISETGWHRKMDDAINVWDGVYAHKAVCPCCGQEMP
jgi:hypothetical protein